MSTLLHFDIHQQPDSMTCGPTCLHAVYQFYNDPIPLKDIISEIPQLAEGGTLAVYLACHALHRGYKTTILPYNLQVFDPTWSNCSHEEIITKLKRQLSFKKDIVNFEVVTNAYLEYLELGGRLRFEILTAQLIRKYLKRSNPILTGLSSTYLYNSAREYDAGGHLKYDDVRGESTGHFVVLAGYNKENRSVLVVDPLVPNPLTTSQYYPVNIYRLICAIMLGILTYDGNLLIIKPTDVNKIKLCRK
jgi:hypothetical protein